MNTRAFRLAAGVVVAAAAAFAPASAQQTAGLSDVTFTKDIAPVLQRSCQGCHRADGVAPMPLTTYEEVRPWAKAIKQRTSIGPHAGVMPPWYVEKNLGIQQFKDDPSLSDAEVAMLAKWVDGGAPRGNPADMPPPRVWPDARSWAIGTPDLIVKSKDILVRGDAPDWWGEIPSMPTGLSEDRYVAAVEVKEVNDVDSHIGAGRPTVGGRFVFHHMIWRTAVIDPAKADVIPDSPSILADEESVNWPVHEVGRNADFFDPLSARLLKAGSYIVSDS
ncbi:MAG TPA: cytochrome c, partial [Vicinamibacterales bacterium]|nr:cytochrome c [Vicinamibacterales bacterium]